MLEVDATTPFAYSCDVRMYVINTQINAHTRIRTRDPLLRRQDKPTGLGVCVWSCRYMIY